MAHPPSGTSSKPSPIARRHIPLPKVTSAVPNDGTPGMFTFGRKPADTRNPRRPHRSSTYPFDFTKYDDVQWNNPMVTKAHLSMRPEPTRESQQRPTKRQRLLTSMILKDKRRALEATHDQGPSSPTRNHLLSIWGGTKLILQDIAAKVYDFGALPVEILQYIFNLVVHAVDNDTDPVLQRTWISHVCRSWRITAVSYQALWDLISPTDTRPWERTMTWFNRLGTSKFHLVIEDRRMRKDGSTIRMRREEVAEFLDKVFAKYDQIFEAKFTIHDLHSSHLILQVFSGRPAPRCLETFSFNRPLTDDIPWPPGDLSPLKVTFGRLSLFNGMAPKLRRFFLTAMCVDWSTFTMENLRYLYLRGIPSGLCPDPLIFRRMLLASPRLAALSLQYAGPNTMIPCNLPPVALPCLRSILLCHSSVRTEKSILSHFIAPGLVALTLLNMAHEDGAPLMTFLTGRYPLLRILSFAWFRLLDTEPNRVGLARFFKSTAELEVLKVMVEEAQMALMVLLQDSEWLYRTGVFSEEERDAKAVLCPNLRALLYNNIPVELVLIFLADRKALGVPIEVVYVSNGFGSTWTEEDLTAIKAEGIKVVVLNTMTTIEEEQALAALM